MGHPDRYKTAMGHCLVVTARCLPVFRLYQVVIAFLPGCNETGSTGNNPVQGGIGTLQPDNGSL